MGNIFDPWKTAVSLEHNPTWRQVNEINNSWVSPTSYNDVNGGQIAEPSDPDIKQQFENIREAGI